MLSRPLLLLPLVQSHPTSGLYQRRLYRRVGVLQAQMQVCVLRIGEPVAGVGLQRGQLPGYAREVTGRVPRYILRFLRSQSSTSQALFSIGASVRSGGRTNLTPDTAS